MAHYKDLLVYQRGFEFVRLIYRLTLKFPKEELYGLTSQLRRAVVSVIANIAEGQGKSTEKDFLKFLYISNGSLNECECYLDLSLSLGYITQEQFDFIFKRHQEVRYLLSRLIASKV